MSSTSSDTFAATSTSQIPYWATANSTPGNSYSLFPNNPLLLAFVAVGLVGMAVMAGVGYRRVRLRMRHGDAVFDAPPPAWIIVGGPGGIRFEKVVDLGPKPELWDVWAKPEEGGQWSDIIVSYHIVSFLLPYSSYHSLYLPL